MADSRRQNGNGRHVWRLVLIAIVAVILLAAFMSRRRGAVPVRVDRAARQDLVTSISTNGKVEPIQNFEAHAPAATTVKKIWVREGQKVRAGDMLMQLDDADVRAQMARALAQLRASEADQSAVQSGGTQEEVLNTRSDLAKAQADRDSAQKSYDALQQLAKTGAAAPSEVREAATRLANAETQLKLVQQKQRDRYSRPEVSRVEAQADQARATYAAAEDQLKHTEIRAPFDGTVYSVPIKQGEYVQQGELLIELANLTRVQVRAFVDEPELGKLANGQPVSITWDALPGKTWHGELTQMPYTVTTYGTRNVGQVLCGVENDDGRLLPNINVTVTVNIANKKDVVTVAREALHDDENGRFVYVIKDGHLDRQPVEAGIANNTRIEITKGVDPGELVALNSLNPSEALRPGLEVRTR
ncbi:MAG: efflux RND transporter periplasmic adaptor subunit [Acidobacteria bacterium]|nr:efflux RND transporter periplasmic adaptor subunit [Acidobacteriota bacterium]MBV9144863.1 efflux RND transporter periplasmic adaptor subunit [Acidobacteriota bacterium]MBV9437542.1 efflux RND transporter periplasmic adaptor subunit [Acidobacteriota bacterium]